MGEARRVLEFPHSHFCEKVRWGLDFKGLPFERKALFPGWHVVVVKRLAPKTTLPVLIDRGAALQGSSEILTYLDQTYPERPLGIPGREAEILAFERSIDREVGVNIRAVLYDRLLDDAALVRFYFTHRLPAYQGLLFRAAYPKIRGLIRQRYCRDEGLVAKARLELERTLDRLDTLFERQPYVFGDRFSRADITVASLLCFLCMPPEHPVAWRPIRDSQVTAFLAAQADRPTTRWVRAAYRDFRRPGA